MTLSQQCKALEALAKTGTVDGAEGQVAAIAVTYAAVRTALEVAIADLPNPW